MNEYRVLLACLEKCDLLLNYLMVCLKTSVNFQKTGGLFHYITLLMATVLN